MEKSSARISIGLVGDRSDGVKAHAAIPRALALAANSIRCRMAFQWLGTQTLAGNAERQLGGFDAIWCVPGSPYLSMDGALSAIRFARERSRPFLGTCGGFQHVVIELARNVLGLGNADHAETNPHAPVLVVTRMACSLAGATGQIQLRDGTRARAIYGQSEIVEQYNCNFGVSPEHQLPLEGAGLKISGVDANGDIRIVELPAHPFFLATLFQPELSAASGVAHPLIAAFVQAAAEAEAAR